MPDDPNIAEWQPFIDQAHAVARDAQGAWDETRRREIAALIVTCGAEPRKLQRMLPAQQRDLLVTLGALAFLQNEIALAQSTE
jgi:hypothetical protein